MADQNQKAKVQPSGYTGDNPATAGPGRTDVRSNTPENTPGEINPSAPNDANIPHALNEELNSEALGTFGYGGEDKPLAQPDGTAADLSDMVPGHGANPARHGQKTFRCADVGYRECNWHIEGQSEEEMLPKIKDHAARVHHLEFKPEAERNVRRAIHEAA
jgi:predicted small metal-binding protein